MGERHVFAFISVAMTLFAAVMVIKPGPNLGTDFRGGTEVEVDFKRDIAPSDIRHAVTASGFSQPEVIRVSEGKAKNRFLIRVQEVSTIGPERQREISRVLC